MMLTYRELDKHTIDFKITHPFRDKYQAFQSFLWYFKKIQQYPADKIYKVILLYKIKQNVKTLWSFHVS